ncbi:DUF1534 domain-containing protein, partial [Pseudomonas syringae pv. actinidiae]|nr:DUF1534 domain-containing protein [Pseudomonas syringae pv. actinidiae]
RTLQRRNALGDALRHLRCTAHSRSDAGASRTACDAERRTIVELDDTQHSSLQSNPPAKCRA